MEPREDFGLQPQPTASNARGIHAPASLLPGLEQRLTLLRSSSPSPMPAQAISEALAHEQWEVRVSAIQSAALGEHAPIALLLQGLQDEHRFVRIAAIRALQQANVPHAAGYLLTALQDRDWQVREMAALTLSETNDQAAEPALTTALHDPNSNVREAATLALEMLKKAQATNPLMPPVLASINQQQPAAERTQQTMAITPSAPQASTEGTTPATTTAPLPITQQRRKVRKGTRFLLIAAAAAILLTVLTAASLDLGWWNPFFGNPDLYQTIGQQQSSHGVTITVTKVYADEGRTIIAYEIDSRDSSKNLFVGTYNLTSPTPQKQEPVQATECDGWHQGIDHCYMIQPAFLVPAGVKNVTITWDVTRILVVQPGSAKNFPPISGHWHFTFTVPFHHVHNQHIPNPIHGGLVIG